MLIPDAPKFILPSIPCSFVLIRCNNSSNTWNKLFRPGLTSRVSTFFELVADDGAVEEVAAVVVELVEFELFKELAALMSCKTK